MRDSGTLNVIQNKWFTSQCDDERYISLSTRTLGSMDDVKGVFVFSATAIGLAFIVLLFEIISVCAPTHLLNRSNMPEYVNRNKICRDLFVCCCFVLFVAFVCLGGFLDNKSWYNKLDCVF